MKRICVPVLLGLLLTFCCPGKLNAQRQSETESATKREPQTPDRKPKHWYTDWKWWVGEVVIAGAFAADAHSTSIRPPGFIETNPILGRNPSNRKLALVSGAFFGVITGLHIASWKTARIDCLECSATEDKWWRGLGYTLVPGITAGWKGTVAAKNYRLTNKSPNNQPAAFRDLQEARSRVMSAVPVFRH